MYSKCIIVHNKYCQTIPVPDYTVVLHFCQTYCICISAYYCHVHVLKASYRLLVTCVTITMFQDGYCLTDSGGSIKQYASGSFCPQGYKAIAMHGAIARLLLHVGF